MGGTYWNQTSEVYLVPTNIPFRFYLFKLRVILCSSWLGAIFALGVTFVLTTSESQRKSNLFRLQCVVLCLVLLYNLEEVANWKYRLDVSWYKANQTVQYSIQSNFTAVALFLEHFIPLLADSALLFKISSFFPFPIFSKLKRRLILGPFWITLFLRFVLTILQPISVAKMLLGKVSIRDDEPYPIRYSTDWEVNLFDYSTLVESSLGSLYCLCASFILLFKAFKLTRSSLSTTGRSRFQKKMRFFAEALTMCFIPPIIFNILSALTLMNICSNYCYFREIGTLNVNVSVLCSILATSWSSIREKWSTETQSRSTYIPVVNIAKSGQNNELAKTLIQVASPMEPTTNQM